MLKAILLSLALAHVALPLWAARDPNPRRGLKRAAFLLVAYLALFGVLLKLVVPRLE